MKKEEIVILRVRPPMGENDVKLISVMIKNRLSPAPVAVPAQHPLGEGDTIDASVFIEGNISTISADQLGGEILGHMLQAAPAATLRLSRLKAGKKPSG